MENLTTRENQKELWIDENIDQLSEEFEEYWSNEILYSGSAWDINKDSVRDEFFDEKYSEFLNKNLEFKGTKTEWYFDEKSNGIKAEGVKGLLVSVWSTYDGDEVEVRENGESWLDMRYRTEHIREAKKMEQLSNAKLIAAAPDLLEALQECMGELYSIHSKYGDKQNARDHSYALTISEKAIEKALK